MKYIKSSHFCVDTDMELLCNLFNRLNDNGISRFDELIKKLTELQVNSFSDLFAYLSGANCDDDLAIVCEDLLERLRLAVPDREAILTSSNEVGMYLMDKLAGHQQEELWVLYIDNSNHIIAEKCLFRGTLDKSIAHPREIFRWAVIYACAGIFVVHNHPSGNLSPSKSDIELTKSLISISQVMHIDFLDHFIVGKGKYLSLKEKQLF
ncbi:RadC family protein [Lactobacillus sp. ESL0228]|uniref:JAB domain-containing protein n=1 Tax=Lactobacillus sp. ESL0228 TaxID=2069352 RepID=UPI000EFA63C0|nr:JAB domain-containing protein [Lactobacillus sp. ESL0228]RMC48683.1 DNA repair protein RadC [Lactobacillus sp. ESL0228]